MATRWQGDLAATRGAKHTGCATRLKEKGFHETNHIRSSVQILPWPITPLQLLSLTNANDSSILLVSTMIVLTNNIHKSFAFVKDESLGGYDGSGGGLHRASYLICFMETFLFQSRSTSYSTPRCCQVTLSPYRHGIFSHKAAYWQAAIIVL